MGSIIKFIQEQDEEIHRGALQWPGMHGLPIRGQANLYKEKELDENYEVVLDFHFKDFDLSNPEDVKQYTAVMDRIVNGWYRQLVKEPFCDPVTGNRKVYVEWVQQYGEINPRVNANIDPYGSAIPRVK